MIWLGLSVLVVAVCVDLVLPRLRPPRRLFTRIDEITARFAAGTEPTEGELMECGQAMRRLHRVLALMNLTPDNRRWSAQHRALFLLSATRVAALGHPDHGEWPVRSELRGLVLPRLSRETGDDPFLSLALVTPALLAGDEALAESSYRRLPPALARVALFWLRCIRDRAPGGLEGATVEALLRKVDVTTHEAPPLSPEQHWALAATRDTWEEFGEPRLAALAPPAACRMRLAEWWNVHDAKSALQVLGWLAEAGHRAQLGADLRPETLDQLSGAKQQFLRENVEKLRGHLILAWDLCRLIEVAREAVKAGYLDEPTAWALILPAGAALRAEYGSWRELREDFLLGWQYWDEQHQLDPSVKAQAEWLIHAPGGPGTTLGWELLSPRALA